MKTCWILYGETGIVEDNLDRRWIVSVFKQENDCRAEKERLNDWAKENGAHIDNYNWNDRPYGLKCPFDPAMDEILLGGISYSCYPVEFRD